MLQRAHVERDLHERLLIGYENSWGRSLLVSLALSGLSAVWCPGVNPKMFWSDPNVGLLGCPPPSWNVSITSPSASIATSSDDWKRNAGKSSGVWPD